MELVWNPAPGPVYPRNDDMKAVIFYIVMALLFSAVIVFAVKIKRAVDEEILMKADPADGTVFRIQ